MIIFQRMMNHIEIKIELSFLNRYDVKISNCLILKTKNHHLIFKFVNVVLQHR